MLRTKITYHFLRSLLLLLLLVSLWAVSIYVVSAAIPGITQQAQTSGSSQAETRRLNAMRLNAKGEVHDIHVSPTDDLVISDPVAQELWLVKPSQILYTVYHGVGSVEDAQMDHVGQIWWVDGIDVFGKLSTETNIMTTWRVTSEEQVLFSALTFDDSDSPWFIEGFGATSKLYQVDLSTNRLCAHVIPGGVSSNDLAYRQGEFWFINWAKDRIIRYQPTMQMATYWALNTNIFSQGHLLDQQKQLWWADENLDSLNRFQPATNEWSQFALPVGKNPLRMAEESDHIWYSEPFSATFGSLPENSVTITTTLSAITSTVSTNCLPLSIENSQTITSETKSIQWQSSTIEANTIEPWTVFQNQKGDQPLTKPYGLLVTPGTVWITDSGSQQLLRLNLDPADDVMHVYLPLISR